jgi:transposase
VINSYYDAGTCLKGARMRGDDPQNGAMFSYIMPEQRVPADHPLRPLRQLVDAALTRLSARFDRMYSDMGRPSIAPEKLLRALLLQVLYSIRSERLLIEQLDYNLLFRWFVGLSMDDPVWNATTFTKNRDRLLDGDVAVAFFEEVKREAKARGLLSDEHFTVDGTLLEAWASHKSFRRKDGPGGPPDDPGNPTVNFRGERRRNATHGSTTDPDAKLYRKGAGRAATLGYLGHVVMENRSGLLVKTCVTPADGHGERLAALTMLDRMPGGRLTLGADRGYDTADFVAELRHMAITPHIAQHTVHRRSNIDARTTRHRGYALSQRKRKQVEQAFGWMKTVGLLRKLRHRGGGKVEWMFTFTAAVYNLVRVRNLTWTPA